MSSEWVKCSNEGTSQNNGYVVPLTLHPNSTSATLRQNFSDPNDVI